MFRHFFAFPIPGWRIGHFDWPYPAHPRCIACRDLGASIDGFYSSRFNVKPWRALFRKFECNILERMRGSKVLHQRVHLFVCFSCSATCQNMFACDFYNFILDDRPVTSQSQGNSTMSHYDGLMVNTVHRRTWQSCHLLHMMPCTSAHFHFQTPSVSNMCSIWPSCRTNPSE